MRINREQLVKIGVHGQVDHPRMKGFRVGYDGKGRMPIGTGGITGHLLSQSIQSRKSRPGNICLCGQ